MAVIQQSSKENIVLFPKTLDYYQVELTRMLETERYDEAVELLRFLQKMETNDPRIEEEWFYLLQWLESMLVQLDTEEAELSQYSFMNDIERKKHVSVFSKQFDLADSLFQQQSEDETAGDEEEEADYLLEYMRTKESADPDYGVRLLQSLFKSGDPSEQMLILEQLAHVSNSEVDAQLKGWLQAERLYPLLQFRTLQILRLRNNTGELSIPRQSRQLQLRIEATPLSLQDYPPAIRAILDRVLQVANVLDPALGYFAEQTWSDLLVFLYGTESYDSMGSLSAEGQAMWAGALHAVLNESIQGTMDDEQIFAQYNIPEEQREAWGHIYEQVRSILTGLRPRTNP